MEDKEISLMKKFLEHMKAPFSDNGKPIWVDIIDEEQNILMIYVRKLFPYFDR